MGFLCSDSHFTPTQSPSRRCFSVAPHVPSMTKATTAFVAPKDIQFLESKAITNFSRSSAAGCCAFHVLPGIAISRTLSILFRLLTSSVGHSTSPTTGRLFNTIITNRRGITSSHPKIYSTGALTDKKIPPRWNFKKHRKLSSEPLITFHSAHRSYCCCITVPSHPPRRQAATTRNWKVISIRTLLGRHTFPTAFQSQDNRTTTGCTWIMAYPSNDALSVFSPHTTHDFPRKHHMPEVLTATSTIRRSVHSNCVHCFWNK